MRSGTRPHGQRAASAKARNAFGVFEEQKEDPPAGREGERGGDQEARMLTEGSL